MRRRLSLCLTLALALGIGLAVAWGASGALGGRVTADGAPSTAQYSTRPDPQRHELSDEPAEAVPGELIVGFAPSAAGFPEREASIAGAGAELDRHLLVPGYSLVRVPPGSEQEFIDRLLGTSGVESVEPNLLRRLLLEPNDEYYPLQWHLPKIGMPAAWDKSMGAGVTVAVLDSGVAYEDCTAAVCGDDYFQAPDFEGTSFVSPRDIVDDDTHPNDEIGHGTHVASTIAEATDNTIGAAGVAPGASVMPVKVLGSEGGTISDEVDGIIHAVDNGADIINLSLGGAGTSLLEEVAVGIALDQGVVVVAAAGNGGEDGIGDPLLDCPACYPGVIAVGATRIDQTLAPYSNYSTGVDGHDIDLVAPGGDTGEDMNDDGFADGVLQQTFDHLCPPEGPPDYSSFTYCFLQGTSFAAPHVAGVAALVRSISPDLTPAEVRDILTSTATDLGDPGYDLVYGYGEVNAAAAVAAAQATAPTPTPTDTPTATPTETAPAPTDTPTPTGPAPTTTPTATLPVGATPTPTPTPTSPPGPGPSPSVRISPLTTRVGLQGKASLQALDMAAPGLGGWMVDITYDPGIVSVASCTALPGGVCDPQSASDTIRVTGAHDPGLQGDTTLASITFQCKSRGISPLALSLEALEDASPGGPQPIDADAVNGTIGCKAPRGDASCDGVVSPIDALLILQLFAALISSLPCQGAADANLDGDANPIDAALILQYDAGIIGSLPP